MNWRRIGLIFLAVFVLSGICRADTDFHHAIDKRLSYEKWVGDPKLANDLPGALTILGSSTPAILNLPAGTYSITNNLTIPANISLRPVRGAIISVAAGKTLTINGHLEAGPYQVFSASGPLIGSIIFGPGAVHEVYPEWWGTNTSPGDTDMTAAIQSACDAASTLSGGSWYAGHPVCGPVVLGPTQYKVTSTITVKETAEIRGAGSRRQTQIISYLTNPATYTFSCPAPSQYNTSGGPKFKGFALACYDGGGGIQIGLPRNMRTTYVGTYQFRNCLIEDVAFTGDTATAGQCAIQGAGWFASRIKDCIITYFDRQIDLHLCDENILENNRHTGGQMQVALNAGIKIQGMTRANPCVVTWVNHGLVDGQYIGLYLIKQTDWKNLNNQHWFTVTRIDDDHFSIGTNTSGYGADYNPATDPGVMEYYAWMGNRNKIINNSFLSAQTGALAYLVVGGSAWIEHNLFEQLSGDGAIDYIIKHIWGGKISISDNDLQISSGKTTLGSFDFSEGYSTAYYGPAFIKITNNGPTASPYVPGACNFDTYCGGVFKGWPYLHTGTTLRRKIIHYGNYPAIDDSIPFNSQEAPTFAGGTAFVGSPHLPGLTNYGGAGTVPVVAGAWVIPADATKANTCLQWLNTGVNGTVSIAVEAKGSVASQTLSTEWLNGAVSGGTGTQALTTSWAYYKVFTGQAATDLGVNLWNADTGHGGTISLRRVVVTYD